MTTSPLIVIRSRIKTAPRQSQIAVFRVKERYNSLFASTVHTQKRVRANDPDLIGVYHGLGGVERFNAAIKNDCSQSGAK